MYWVLREPCHLSQRKISLSEVLESVRRLGPSSVDEGLCLYAGDLALEMTGDENDSFQ